MEDPDTGEIISLWGSEVSARTRSTYLGDVRYSPVVYKYVEYECYFNYSRVAGLTSSTVSGHCSQQENQVVSENWYYPQ